ncbi:MAG: alpha/beta hydrolase [Pseudomonas sp.]|uniref:alpha/beta hydrolase n=1 Tax=Pseudomonas sp. TaxID=306 RepID=UPI00273368EB|nr:alpha/beta hydrolase [Pseudomonas sp.]MDP3848078.1 alpha/beta hydrolase [Pseudomonas sp.]
MDHKVFNPLLAALLLTSTQITVAGPLLDKWQEHRTQRQSTTNPSADAPKVLRNLAYGSDPLQQLDVYLPDNREHAPVLLMVHGGAWRIGDKGAAAVVDNKIKRWLPKGFIFVSLNYRLLPDTTPVQQAEDVARALAFAQRQAASWGGDSSKFILLGHSAGAHLVSLLAADPARAKALGAQTWLGTVALDSAALDVEQIMQRPHARFYDKAFGAAPDYWATASPLKQLKKTATPLLLICSSQRNDSCPPARAFVEQAQRLGIRAQLRPEDRSHQAINQDLGLANDYTQAVEAFLAGLDSQVAQRLGINP